MISRQGLWKLGIGGEKCTDRDATGGANYKQAQSVVRLTLFRPHVCAFRSDWLIVYAELRFSQRFPQCFPQFLCKDSVTFSHDTRFVARKVHDCRRLPFEFARVDDAVDRCSKLDIELFR